MPRTARLFPCCTLALLYVLWASVAFAQVNIAGYDVTAARQEKIGDKHWMLTGAVEIEQGDTKLYADQIEWTEDSDLVVAKGNVVLTQANNRIASDSAEYHTKTGLGTFYRARGIASVQPPRQTPQAGGIMVPTANNVETDVYFFGETVEKIGYKKYKLTNGGFSSCVQPTPRWDLSADSIVLNVDHYTLLRQALFKVKGVPMFYVPILYFPTKEDGRATGFLIPTYGMSTIRGQTIHNAFFWAINRSQDATFLYDWFSKTGTGTGAEYRFNLGDGSDGTLTAYRLDERAASYQVGGVTQNQQAARSYTVNGSANRALLGHLRARARINYFSSILTNQTFNTNVNDASRNNRSYGANVVGAWRSYSLNGTFDRSEYFNTTTSSGVTGSSPRISVSRNERPLFKTSPLYFSFGGEVAHLDRRTRSNGTTVDDRSIGRVDVMPVMRYPFTKLRWLTVNSSVSWRETYYTRSLDPATLAPVDVGLNRRYYTVQTQIVGPSFMRVFDTPNNGYASRFKHSIEPYLNAQHTSSIDAFNQIVQVDGTDTVVGGTTNLSYGLNNRLYAKRRVGQTTQAQEIVSVDIGQTYYTNAKASQFDARYNTSYSTSTPNHFSPISMGIRFTPSPAVNGTLRAEVDSHYRQLRTLSANANYNIRTNVQASVGWSHKFYIPNLSGFNNKTLLDHYLNVTTSAHTTDNKYGVNYSANYDVLHSRLLQERITTFYNAQCCGLAFEYQRYNFSGLPSFLVPVDHRYLLSFTLAGLGNFSPFSGGLSTVPR